MPGPSAHPDPIADATLVPTGIALERALRDNAVAMDNMVEVVKNLLACHVDLLEVIDGISEELSTVSADVAALTAGERDTSLSVAPARHAEETLRQAAALAHRAAAILERAQHTAPDPAVPLLRSVEG